MTRDDLAHDFRLLDGTESVSVTLRRPDGIVLITIPQAMRRAMTRSESSTNGVDLVVEQVDWHVPQSALPGNEELVPGDTILVGSETWMIVTARRETLGTRWRCSCRRQA